jgi:hypothetical protein
LKLLTSSNVRSLFIKRMVTRHGLISPLIRCSYSTDFKFSSNDQKLGHRWTVTTWSINSPETTGSREFDHKLISKYNLCRPQTGFHGNWKSKSKTYGLNPFNVPIAMHISWCRYLLLVQVVWLWPRANKTKSSLK